MVEKVHILLSVLHFTWVKLLSSTHAQSIHFLFICCIDTYTSPSSLCQPCLVRCVCLWLYVPRFFFCLDALYDGRLYRCDVKFSGNDLQENNIRTTSSDRQPESDEDDANWEEREASRTHSVKFTDDVDPENKEVSLNNGCFNFTVVRSAYASVRRRIRNVNRYFVTYSGAYQQEYTLV